MEKKFIIIIFFFLHFVFNFFLIKVFIQKFKYIQMCFLNYILFIICLLICLFFSIFDITEFFVILYFLSVFSLVYLQFFYGFVTGMSSDLVYIFYEEKYSKSEIIELFHDDKGNSTILKNR